MTSLPTSSGFEPGMVLLNRYSKYRMTLVERELNPGDWLVEPAPGHSYGKYVYSEQEMRDHYTVAPHHS